MSSDATRWTGIGRSKCFHILCRYGVNVRFSKPIGLVDQKQTLSQISSQIGNGVQYSGRMLNQRTSGTFQHMDHPVDKVANSSSLTFTGVVQGDLTGTCRIADVAIKIDAVLHCRVEWNQETAKAFVGKR